MIHFSKYSSQATSCMPRLIVTVLLCCSMTFSAHAQHTLTIEQGDSIHLDIDIWRGDLQWQVSDDKETWTDLDGQTGSTLKYLPTQFPAYFRVQIIEGSCVPHYSETVTVTVPVLATVTTLPPRNIGTHSAETGGSITVEETGVTAAGVVYSTAPGPDLNNSPYTTDESENGSFVTQLTDLEPNTTYYVRAYITTSEDTTYGAEYSFTTLQEVIYTIGDEGPAGGIVFYDKGAYSDGWRYLEAAPSGWSGASNDPWVDLEWGCYQTLVGGTSTDVGTGLENTQKILENGCADEHTAVSMAAEAVIGGYTDWFLPSRDELNLLYNNLYNLGPNFHSTYGFLTLTYTSSSEEDAIGAWGYDFAGGSNLTHIKTDLATYAMRPVRRF